MGSHSEQLLIFTRFPEEGQVKTRLIPAIGVKAATALHRQMAEHTLKQAKQLRERQPNKLQITVWVAGNPAIADLQTWLGADLTYLPQSAGNLGARLIHGFQTAFTAGAQRVIAIGTDCPNLNADRMSQALHSLETHDVVLGPALDGGYYLIGLRSPQPLLFDPITWGTSSVLQETLLLIEQQQLSYVCLAPLADVDRPDDLMVWEAAIAQFPGE